MPAIGSISIDKGDTSVTIDSLRIEDLELVDFLTTRSCRRGAHDWYENDAVDGHLTGRSVC